MTPNTQNSVFLTYLRYTISVLGQILGLLQKVIFADLTFIAPSTSKKEAGFDNTKHPKICSFLRIGLL